MAAELVLSSASKTLPVLYKSLVKKEKERFDTIVEPLQCVLQLALLSFCEENTKITIQNNLVELQFPSSYQGIVRWYQNDSKEDLYFLFNALRRFTVFYNKLKDVKHSDLSKHNLYDTLIHYSIQGIQNLINTYSNHSKPSLLYTLQMYKVLLESPETFHMDSLEKDTQKNIDNVFKDITKLYDNSMFYIIFDTLVMLRKNNINKEDKKNIIHHLNHILMHVFSNIHTWIHKNVVY